MSASRTASRSWLDLLLADASAGDFDAAEQAAVTAATSTGERRQVEVEALGARRLRTQLVDHRRRVAELAALNDLGVRLTAMRDLDTLLQEIVTQARRLLDVDIAYLSLLEPDGSLLIRVTDGSIGPHMRGVRLPPHSGLAGRVVDTGEPVSSPDYLNDPDLQHHAQIDEVAKGEGLRTIAGVPLRLQGEVIGVLMAAQRAVNPPTANELSLLASLSALAAVAIENARLFTEHRRAMTALAEANEELRRTADSVNRATALHEQLMHAALSGGGVRDVIASLSEVVSGLVSFADAEDRVVAVARGGATAAGDGEARPVEGKPPAAAFAEAGARRPIEDGNVITVPVFAADTYFGSVQVDAEDVADDRTLRLLERSALTIALLESTERTVAAAERRTVDDLLDQLVSRRAADSESFNRRSLLLGLDLTLPHRVLVVDADDGHDDELQAWASDLTRTHGGLAGRVAGCVVAVVGAGYSPSPGAGLAYGTAGLSEPVAGVLGLAGAYEEARDCLSTLLAIGRSQLVATAADLGPFRFLLSTSGRNEAARYVHATLGPLLEYDDARGSRLLDTVREYFASGQHHTEAARALNVHPNTLYQRLRRVDAILGPGWTGEARSLDIALALRIRALLQGP